MENKKVMFQTTNQISIIDVKSHDDGILGNGKMAHDFWKLRWHKRQKELRWQPNTMAEPGVPSICSINGG